MFNFAAAVSLVLCLATVVLWASCPRGGRSVHWARRDGRRFFVECRYGWADLLVLKPWPCNDPVTFGPHDQYAMLGPGTEWSHLDTEGWSGTGFVVVGTDGRVPEHHFDREKGWSPGLPVPPGLSVRPITGWYVGIPMWMLVGLTSLLPVAWFSDFAFAAHRRRQHAQRGHCLSCRYNLTGNTSGVCPECGTTISK